VQAQELERFGVIALYHFQSVKRSSGESGYARTAVNPRKERHFGSAEGKVRVGPLVWSSNASAMGIESTSGMGGGHATVLVVEDDPSLRLLCRVNLELEDYRVLEAGTVDQGEQLLEEEDVDVVLLDLHVGDRRGVELLPLIREEHPHVRVCLLSGTSETDPPRMAGVQGFIRKPFEIDVLSQTVRDLASGQPARN
jgi:CheY-like chemotaxis protein